MSSQESGFVPTDSPSAVEAQKNFLETKHFESLDGLRCLSIIAVLWHHGPGIGMQGLAGRGYYGVQLFFAISGFLITTLLLRELERHGSISLSKFYIRRSLRIFPLYYATLAVYVALISFIAAGTQTAAQFFSNLPYFLTYTSNWFVRSSSTFGFAWSLAAEEQFYASWPAVLRFFKPRQALWLLLSVLLILITLSLFGIRSRDSNGLGLLVLTRLQMAIFWGCVWALILNLPNGFRALFKFAGQPFASAAVLLLCVLTLTIPANIEVLIHFLFSVLVVTCVAHEDHSLAPFFRNKWVVHIGKISYGMYLLHGLVYDAIGLASKRFEILPHAHTPAGFLLATPLTILIASLSFRYFEDPFLRWKSKFST